MDGRTDGWMGGVDGWMDEWGLVGGRVGCGGWVTGVGRRRWLVGGLVGC